MNNRYPIEELSLAAPRSFMQVSRFFTTGTVDHGIDSTSRPPMALWISLGCSEPSFRLLLWEHVVADGEFTCESAVRLVGDAGCLLSVMMSLSNPRVACR